MNFSQRLSRYLVGIFIGLMLTFVLFGQRKCTGWLPENRVKETILEYRFSETAHVRCLMECYELDRTQVRSMVQLADVDFSASETRATPKRYILKDAAENAWVMAVELRDSSAVVSELTYTNAADGCGC